MTAVTGGKMDEATFRGEMARAKAMQELSPGMDADYWAGYQRGLRRRYHGERFGTEEEHERFLSLSEEEGDEFRRRFGEGYRDGLGKGA